MPKHPKADLLIAIANGEQMQFVEINGECFDCSGDEALRIISSISHCPLEVRIKPKTITINGIEVPAPVTEPLENGQEYWSCFYRDEVMLWSGVPLDRLWLKHRSIHLTQESAEAHFEALVKASGGEV